MAALAALAGGCGGASAKAPVAPERCIGGRADEMSFQVRRDRRTIRNLENEVSLLRAQLRDTPVGVEPPAPVASPPPVAAAPLPEVATDALYGDVEIVYEGDAARATGGRPRIELHETTRTAEGLGGSDGEAAAPPTPLPDLGSERLPVVPGRIPKVDEQLRSARAASGTGFPVRPGSDPIQPAPRQPATRLVVAPAPAPAASAPLPTAAVVAPAQVAASTAIPAAADPIGEYRRAISALRRGHHQRAAAGLRAFLDHHPRHYLSDNVQYFLAESYFRREQYKAALGEYQLVVRRYWRGNKLPSALLKMALCHIALGRPAAARAALERLVERFPRTKPADAARAKLAELGSP